MSLKRLKNYLDAIENNRPIDAEKFRTLLDGLNLQNAPSHRDFVVEKVRGKEYLVRIINPSLFAALKALSSLDNDSRISLASQNHSHYTSVSGAMLIARNEDAYPEVIVFDQLKQFQGSFPKSNCCLIIENEQNFLKTQDTLKLLRNTDLICYEPIDVIYGDGARITNQLYDLFFKQYAMILLLIDFDLGALTIARTLINRHGDSKIRYLYPNDIEVRLSKVISVKPADYIRKVEKIGREYPSLSLPASIIRKHRKVIEQEDYLNDV